MVVKLSSPAAICSVASGVAAALAACAISSSLLLSSCSQPETMRAMASGLRSKSPKPLVSTKPTLPHSCAGEKLEVRVGSAGWNGRFLFGGMLRVMMIRVMVG